MLRPECPVCGKTFTRQAHLERHESMHGNTMRWPCAYCGSTYTRRDALNRHLTRCAPGIANARVPSTRVNRSCEECSTRKVKCSRGQPCRRCSQASLRCNYLVHGLSRQIQTASPPVSYIENPGSDINISSNDTHILEDSNLGDPQSTSLSADGPRDLQTPGDMNPWLSWGWTDPMWGDLDFEPYADPDGGHGNIIVDVTVGSDNLDIQTSASEIIGSRFARIVDARIDLVEYHRQSILQRVEQASDVNKRGSTCQWLSRAHFPLLLKTYFKHHHRHTPIIHLPTFNIADCPTSLIFAIILIAASSLPKLARRPKDLIALIDCAYQLAMEHEENLDIGETETLETLQSLVLLAILDRIMLRGNGHSQCIIDLGNIARLARTHRIFDETDDPPGLSWQHWAAVESRRRLGLIVYAFDAFISVLHDEIPTVRTDELNLQFPNSEDMFMAASEREWREASRSGTRSTTATFSVSLTLSSLFCNTAVPLPDTLMGRFVLLNGILQRAWRTKRSLQENTSAMSDTAVELYARSEMRTIHQALGKWREGWPDKLLDFEPRPQRPSLYQDRAEAYWHLAGVIMLPHIMITTPRKLATATGGKLSVQDMLERLMLLSDQSLLPNGERDFDATYRLVMGHRPSEVNTRALGALIYRETDTA